MDAGHFFDAGVSGNSLYFDERNVHCQCFSCNVKKSGNKAIYASNLVRQYGDDIIMKLRLLKRPEKWDDFTYVEKLKEYRAKLRLLEKQEE